jgi:methionine synthase II (cobalamin-independent)
VRIAKIFWSFVSEWQNDRDRVVSDIQRGRSITMGNLPDHGLPLVQLKEQRRDLVVALQNRNGPVTGWELMQIAAIQQAIQAFEEVIADLDAELEAAA